MKLVLFGAPGAGKGTLAGHIKKILPDIAHVSTGDLFRYNMKNNTPIGLKAKEYINAGQLVPDEVVIGMVKDRLAQEDAKDNFMLDGFPRTVNQAKELEKITELDFVYVIEVPREVLLNRILGRLSCSKCSKIYNKFNPELTPKKEGVCDDCGSELSHRSDDNEETLNSRIDTYENQSVPCIKLFNEKGIVKKVDGTRTLHMSGEEIKNLLGI
ncbi:MAG: adenylate kinase [archaeon]|nr:adenylate kinase [archaeon]